MNWHWWLGLAILAVILVLVFTSKAKRSKREIIASIENHANGTEGGWDWDDFTSIRIADPFLEAARIECLRIENEELPWERNAAFLEVARKLKENSN
ncbi:MAG: hypothetical protein JWO20_72 [Candidatus Angelobacter sp.]|jgi:hypothetical protein|nr:hypothetical protein [Candidatus Angelobacter sp.]